MNSDPVGKGGRLRGDHATDIVVSVRMPGKFTIADRYGIERVIGSGGMGIVYEVTHLVTGHRYALKTLQGGPGGDASLVARILDESKVTAGIDSEHIVRVTDGGIDEETRLPFLVMELLEGASVAEELGRRGGLPAAEVVDLMRQASLALGKTHAAGVIHRDLKPENLFLARSDDGPVCLKILDFGIAKTVETGADARTTRNVGTPVYMSPEQFRGDGDIDHHADIYALGHVAFALLTGRPYWGQEAHAGTYALMRKVLEGTHEPATRRAAALGVSLPRAFDRWFDQATARSAVRRFHNVADLVDGLAAALDVESPRSSGAAALPARGWRRRAGAISIAGAAILAAFTVAPQLWRGRHARAPLTPTPARAVASRAPEPPVAAILSTSTPIASAPPTVRVRSRQRAKIERSPTGAVVPIMSGRACAAGDGPVGAAPAAPGARVALWDGDRAGLDGQGWEGCDKAPGCECKIQLALGGRRQRKQGPQVSRRREELDRVWLEPVRLVPRERGCGPQAIQPPDVPDSRRGEVARRGAGPRLLQRSAGWQRQQQRQRQRPHRAIREGLRGRQVARGRDSDRAVHEGGWRQVRSRVVLGVSDLDLERNVATLRYLHRRHRSRAAVRDLTSPPLDDRQWQALVARAAAGDEPARLSLLEGLWPVWTEMVRSSRSMGSFARSDDHVDAVVGRLIEKIARPDGRALRSYLDWQASHGDQTFADWIRIVTKNAVRDYLRDQLGTGKPTQAGEPSVKRLLNEFAVSPAIQAEERGHRPPVTAAQTARELLEFAALRLPEGHLQALRQWLAGATFEEIGRAAGEPSAVARRKVRAGIAVLRRHFGEDDGAAEPEQDL